MENWSPIMFWGMDVTTLDHQPLFNNNILMSLFFVVFVLICVFFILNMVIGVSIMEVRERGVAGAAFSFYWSLINQMLQCCSSTNSRINRDRML